MFEYLTPRTAVGFLFCGWVGAIFATTITTEFPGIVGLIVALGLYVPLWVLATRARDKQIEIANFVRDVHAQLEAMEERKDEGNNDSGVTDTASL